MAENVLKTRIQLKYDYINNWNNSNLILKSGEIAIAVVPTDTSVAGLTPPAIGLKVGDGEHTFSNLPWIQAVAGDVYNWAKAPEPDLDEFGDTFKNQLNTYISGEIQNTNTTYQIVPVKDKIGNFLKKYELQSKNIGDSDWKTVEGSTIDLNEIYNSLSSFEEFKNWIKGNQQQPDSFANYVMSLIGNAILRQIETTISISDGQIITGISQRNGKIEVTTATLNINNTTGTLPVSRGGTGQNQFPLNQVLIGNGSSSISTKEIDNQVTRNSENLITSGAVSSFIQAQLQGLTGAMHFIGISDDPNISDQSEVRRITVNNNESREAIPGDVVVYKETDGANESHIYKEFVWTGTSWELLGDEDAYVRKGNINNDIFDNEIELSKINGLNRQLNELDAALQGKVDKVDGKGLSSNDYTFDEKTKLQGIEEGADVNIIESISIDGTPLAISSGKNINIESDSFGTIKGAQVPVGVNSYQDIDIDVDTKKLIFARIAQTGDVMDLQQDPSRGTLILNCGDSNNVDD